MALAETAELAVKLTLGGNFAKNLTAAQRSLGKFDAKLNNTESRAYRAGQQIGTGIKRGAALAAGGIAFLALNVEQGLDSLVELEKQQKQTEAAIKSTGGAAGITATEVRALAEEFESMNATVGDEVIQNAENLLLSFTNIKKKAFKPTLQAALDLNTRFGGGPDGLAGTMKVLGKALNDPTKGLGALARKGVTFDATLTKRIKKLQKEGKLYEAQNLILKELNKRFGGAFAAEGDTTGAKVAKFKDAIEDLQRTLAAGMLPVVSNIADALDELFRDPEVQRGVKEFGEQLAAFFTKDKIKGAISTIKDVFKTIGAVAGPAADAIGKMVDAFNKLPPDLKKLLVGGFLVNKATNGLLTNIAGGIGAAIKNMVTGSMNVQAGIVNVAGGAGAGAGIPGAAGKGGGLGNLVKTAAGGAASLGLSGAAGLTIAAIAPAVLGELAIKISEAATGKTAQQLTDEGHIATGVARGMRADVVPSLNRLPGNFDKPLEQILDSRIGRTGGLSPDARDEQQTLGDIALQVQRKGEQTAGKLDDTKSAVEATKDKVAQSGQAVQNTTRSSALTNAAIGAAATAASTAAIVGAIYAARPIVNVTNVTKSTTIQNRYGPGNGSQGTDNGHAGNSGPLP